MASSLVLKVGSVTAPINFTATDAQVGAALTRYATSLGIPIDGTAQQNLAAVLSHIVDDVKRRARAQELAELRAAQDAANQLVVDADTNL